MASPAVLVALALSVFVNAAALCLTIRVLKRYKGLGERAVHADKALRKAHISRKKYSVAASYVKRVRTSAFKASLFQFLIPFLSYMVILLSLYPLLSFFGMPTIMVALKGACLAPIPIEQPILIQEGRVECAANVVWIPFLVFLASLPFYDYYAKKYLEAGVR